MEGWIDPASAKQRTRASELLGRKLEEAEKRTLRGALRGAVTEGDKGHA